MDAFDYIYLLIISSIRSASFIIQTKTRKRKNFLTNLIHKLCIRTELFWSPIQFVTNSWFIQECDDYNAQTFSWHTLSTFIYFISTYPAIDMIWYRYSAFHALSLKETGIPKKCHHMGNIF